MLGPGKIRGLQETTSPEGVFAVLAIDHRDSLRVVLDPDAPESVPAGDMTALKLELVRLVGREASGVLIDPEYGAAQAIAAGALPGAVGLLVSLEAQGYLGDPSRGNELLHGWSVGKLKKMGASVAKLLLLYRPDDPATAERQEALVSQVVAACAEHDLPLLVEPAAYRIDGRLPDDHRAAVVESAQRIGALGVDVLKLPFPALGDDRAEWRDACAELAGACRQPWALLSGGGDYDRFRDQVEVACSAGASGFMVGRAVWQEAATTAPGMRSTIIDTAVRSRLKELRSIATATGRSWSDHFEFPAFEPDWYMSY